MKIAPNSSAIDLSRVILWQYNDAVKLQSIIHRIVKDGNDNEKQEGLLSILGERCTTEVYRRLYETSIDIEHADEFGLYLLSSLFGFERPMYTIQGQANPVPLGYNNIDTWRRYLKGMIYLIDSDGTLQDLNEWCKRIFPDAEFSIGDSFQMSITYNFNPNTLTSEDLVLLNLPNFLPHPAGVVSNYNTNMSAYFFAFGNLDETASDDSYKSVATSDVGSETQDTNGNFDTSTYYDY